MTRNQFVQEAVKNFAGDPMFTVASNGNIQPTTQQSVDPGGSVLIQSDPAAQTPYTGYICAWRNGACRCADIISNLGGEQHMRVTVPVPSYDVKSNATTGLT